MTVDVGVMVNAMPWTLVVLAVTLTAVLAAIADGARSDVMTNHWFVQLHDELGDTGAQTVAKRNGFTFVRPVGSLGVCVLWL